MAQEKQEQEIFWQVLLEHPFSNARRQFRLDQVPFPTAKQMDSLLDKVKKEKKGFWTPISVIRVVL